MHDPEPGRSAGPAILLVGCGKMGSALLSGWLSRGSVERVVVVEPNPPPTLGPLRGVTMVRDPAGIPAESLPDLIVFAVKPQLMDEVAPAYRGLVVRGAPVLSIAAGKTLAGFQRYFGEAAAIVRSMPNTPAAVGGGITVAVANANASDELRALSDALLKAVGEVEWVEDETLLDAVTAVSGSGPAYVFLLIEALASAGARCGLPPELAMRLARSTVIGSGELARLSTEPAEQLRRNVTSPRGTTEAALNVLMADGAFQELFDRAVAAATARSRELAG